jgi:uncharacterized protein
LITVQPFDFSPVQLIMKTFIIKIEDIENAPQKTLQVNFNDVVEGIKSKEPITADLTVTSLGDFIEVKGNVQGSATLVCDLCLEEFEHEIDIEIEELFAKNTLLDEYGAETEIKDGQFVTDLQGSSDLDICDLLYQSVILDFPNKKVCGINCKGGDIFIRDENSPQKEADPRMAIFKNIKVNGE